MARVSLVLLVLGTVLVVFLGLGSTQRPRQWRGARTFGRGRAFPRYLGRRVHPLCPPEPDQPQKHRDRCDWTAVKNAFGCIVRYTCVKKDPPPKPCPKAPVIPEESESCNWITVMDARGCVITYECEPVTQPPCPNRKVRPDNSPRCLWRSIADDKGCVVDFECEPVSRLPRFLPYRRRFPLPLPRPFPAGLPSIRPRSFGVPLPPPGPFRNWGPNFGHPAAFGNSFQPFGSFRRFPFSQPWRQPILPPLQNFAPAPPPPFSPRLPLIRPPTLPQLPLPPPPLVAPFAPLAKPFSPLGKPFSPLGKPFSPLVAPLPPPLALNREAASFRQSPGLHLSILRDVPQAGCVDEHKMCDLWAKYDQCRENPRYMSRKCKQSCNACEKRSFITEIKNL